MFESLFGAEMPLAVRFFLAFLVVLGLIGITAWAVRRLGAGRMGGAGGRGRQPRLAVIDYAAVDGRRKLILVRRDNVEHLLMIGGPTDVVVEPNIVRAVAATAARPTGGVEAPPRAIPLPENGGSWPLQPEPTGGLRPPPRVAPLPEELPPLQPARPVPEAAPPRPQRDTLAALADELSSRPTPPRRAPVAPRPPQPAAEIKPEPRVAAPEPAAPATPDAPIVPPAPPKAAAAEPAPSADQSLADMAQRLEAALRKPGAAPESRPPRPTPAAEQGRPSDAAPTMPRPQPGQSKTTLYDSLEQEMASLLGRQNKT